MGIIIILLVTLLFLAVINSSLKSKRKKTLINSHLNKVQEFTPSQVLLNSDITNGIAVDNNREKICIFSISKKNKISSSIYHSQDILSVEIIEDGDCITSTARGSQVAGLAIGGVLLGGVGAVVGGLSGKKKESKKISQVDLNVTINKLSNPINTFSLLTLPSFRKSEPYKTAIESAKKWEAIIAILIKRADMKMAEMKATDSSIVEKASEDAQLAMTENGKKVTNSWEATCVSSSESFDKPASNLFKKEVKWSLKNKIIGTLFFVFFIIPTFFSIVFESSSSTNSKNGKTVSQAENEKQWPEINRQNKINQLLADVKLLPVKPYEPNLIAYKKLYKLDPSNSNYLDKIKFYENKIFDEENEKKLIEKIQNTGFFSAGNMLKYPQSAKFRNVKNYNSIAPVVCGEISGKNDFGVQMGYQRFIAAGDLAFFENQVEDMNEIWEKFCK